MSTGRLFEEIWQRLPDQFDLPWFKERAELAASLAGPGLKVLDLGCGDGRFSQHMAEAGAEVVAADVAAEAIARASRRSPPFETVKVEYDGPLPFSDCSFDSVFCSEVISQVVDTQLFLSEVRRVLKAGGRLALTVPNHGRALRLRLAVAGYEGHYQPLGPQLRFYTKRSLKAVLGQFGFEHVEIGTTGGRPLLRQILVAKALRG